jgi:MarR family 2-MHQ and catechol resistance regulon transcriptional repressor
MKDCVVMPTKYSGTPEEVRALDAYIKLIRAANTVSGRIHRHLLETGLSTSQFGVLDALYHLGPLHQNVIARKMLMSGGNVTLIVGNLVRRGLVDRQRQAADRRYAVVKLTDRGRDLIGRIFPRHVEGIVREMRNLNAGEQEDLARLCRKLGRGTAAADASL